MSVIDDPQLERLLAALHARSDAQVAAMQHFQAAVEWQRHGSEAAFVETCEIVRILASISLRIIADHDGA